MTTQLARKITWNSSKQTYYTAHFMVDNGMQDDCYRAYSYFRWADDVIDEECQTQAQRLAFIQRQTRLVDGLCKGQQFCDLTPEEELIADLIDHEHDESCRLRSYIRNFLAILAFDAERKGRIIDQKELTWYSDRLGVAVTDAIQHFIGHDHPYPDDEHRYLAATAAHIVHMLRDMIEDIREGYINIPGEYLAQKGVTIDDLQDLAAMVKPVVLRDFVKKQVELARGYFTAGKEYLDTLDVLRCKLAGYWYCLRFEGVMDAVEKDGYILRAEYGERRKLKTLWKAVCMAISVSVQHLLNRVSLVCGSQKDFVLKPGN
jgi:phytoene/squalene synthetase